MTERDADVIVNARYSERYVSLFDQALITLIKDLQARLQELETTALTDYRKGR